MSSYRRAARSLPQPLNHRLQQTEVRATIHASRMERELRAEFAVAGRASGKASGKARGRPRTDVVKVRDARMLYDIPGKTADEVCKVVGVTRRRFLAYLAQQRDQQSIFIFAN